MSLGRVSRLFLSGSLPFSPVRASVGRVGRVSRLNGATGLVVAGGRRELSHVPVDDHISGLTEEQIQVELAHAAMILAMGACLTTA